VTLSTLGTYYWTASYSGDSVNLASASSCGSETEIVTLGKIPQIQGSGSASGITSATATGLVTKAVNSIVLAYVSADGPASGHQTVIVSGSGLTWSRVAGQNAAKGDAEVWIASANAVKSVNVTATASQKGYKVALTAVSYKGASGIGANGTFESASGAPTGTITTTHKYAWVWAVGFDGGAAKSRKVGSGQTLFSQKVDTTAGNTSWVQSMTSLTPAASTAVKINDTVPMIDPYNLVLVEIF
jgi:hypothetical protein